MRRKIAVLATSVVALVVVGRFTVLAQPPAAPKPTPEHQKLAFFVGTWTNEGEMKASPMVSSTWSRSLAR